VERWEYGVRRGEKEKGGVTRPSIEKSRVSRRGGRDGGSFAQMQEIGDERAGREFERRRRGGRAVGQRTGLRV